MEKETAMGILVWFFGNFLAVLSILKYLAFSHHAGVLAAIFLMECVRARRNHKTLTSSV